MNTENRLLPVPVYTKSGTVYENIKKTRKVNASFFMLVFALYLLSTLLGSALVPGKLKLEGSVFLLSVSQNGATFLCAERCFFAFFYLICGFTPLRFPTSLLVSVFSGIYTGICIRLLVYRSGALSSVVISFFLALQLLADVFCASSAFYAYPHKTVKRRFKNYLMYCTCIITYVFISLFLSFLITLMLK